MSKRKKNRRASRAKDSEKGRPTPDVRSENTLVAFPWFLDQQWDQLLAVADDRDELEDTFSQWAGPAAQKFNELAQSGVYASKVIVDISELVHWCQARQLPVNAESRTSYAIDKLVAMHHARPVDDD